MRYLVAVSTGSSSQGALFDYFDTYAEAEAYENGLERGASAFGHDLVAEMLTYHDLKRLARNRGDSRLSRSAVTAVLEMNRLTKGAG